jgi:hypothetical protein
VSEHLLDQYELGKNEIMMCQQYSGQIVKLLFVVFHSPLAIGNR